MELTTRSSGTAQVFRRRSLKYLIPLQQTAFVMQEVQRHLPVHRRGMTHSVYLDSPSRELYAQRLVQLEDAKLFRFRWYGDDAPGTVWIEVKVHKTRTQSTKTRFQLSAAQALLFAAGNDHWREGTAPYGSMPVAVQQVQLRTICPWEHLACLDASNPSVPHHPRTPRPLPPSRAATPTACRSLLC